MGEEETTMIPIIDMQENNVSKLREACEKWGCFRVVNHGISKELMAEIKRVAAELFDLPVEIKRRNKQGIAGINGYLEPTQSKHIHEALTHDNMPSSLSFASFSSNLAASPRQREILEKYARNIHKLATDITSKMAKSMGLNDDSVIQVGLSSLRMNKYNVTQENIGFCGLMMHTDSSLITILQDDEQMGGLEIEDPSGKIRVVDPFPASFLINLGDVAVPWSNGKMRYLKHRVVCKDLGVRMSIATVVVPGSDEEEIKAPREFLEGDCPPKYIPFKCAEFRKLRADKKMFVGEALELLRWKN